VQEVALDTFAFVDAVHEEHNGTDELIEGDGSANMGRDESIGDPNKEGREAESEFDPCMLEDAMKPLYRGTRSLLLQSFL
jgi:hypothetical protein